MSLSNLLFLAVLVALTLASIGFRRLRAQRMPDIPDGDFIASFERRSSRSFPEQRVLQVRMQVARALGIPTLKLSPDHTASFLEGALAADLTGFSILWHDLLYETIEARDAAQLPRREVEPATIAEIMDDLLQEPKGHAAPSSRMG